MPPKLIYQNGVATFNLLNPVQLVKKQIDTGNLQPVHGLDRAQTLEKDLEKAAKDLGGEPFPEGKKTVPGTTPVYGRKGDPPAQLVFAIDSTGTERRDDCIQIFVVRSYEVNSGVKYELCLRVHVVNAAHHYPVGSSQDKVFQALVRPHYFLLTNKDPIRHPEPNDGMYFDVNEVPAITCEILFTVDVHTTNRTETITMGDPKFVNSIVRLQEAATFDNIKGEVKLSPQSDQVVDICDVATIRDAVRMSQACVQSKGEVSFDLLRAATLARVLAECLREQDFVRILRHLCGHTSTPHIPPPPRPVHVTSFNKALQKSTQFFAEVDKGELDVLNFFNAAASKKVISELSKNNIGTKLLSNGLANRASSIEQLIDCTLWLLLPFGTSEFEGQDALRSKLQALSQDQLELLYKRLSGVLPEYPHSSAKWTSIELLSGKYTQPARSYKSLLRQRILITVISNNIGEACELLKAANNKASSIQLKADQVGKMNSNTEAVKIQVFIKASSYSMDADQEFPTRGIVFEHGKEKLRLKLPALNLSDMAVVVEVEWSKSTKLPPQGTALLVLVHWNGTAFSGRLYYRHGSPLKFNNKKEGVSLSFPWNQAPPK